MQLSTYLISASNQVLSITSDVLHLHRYCVKQTDPGMNIRHIHPHTGFGWVIFKNQRRVRQDLRFKNLLITMVYSILQIHLQAVRH